jgi:hypothetical protein
MKNPPANHAADVLLAATTVVELHGGEKLAVPKGGCSLSFASCYGHVPHPTNQSVGREADHLHKLGCLANFEVAAELVESRWMEQSPPRLTFHYHHGNKQWA